MPLHDLTPELRTRLSRVERNVGWFVLFASVVLLTGFVYYLYSTAEHRGWFVTKINFATGLNDASGFAVGDDVKLMGFPVGDITRIEPNPPAQPRGVTIFFRIRDPYWGYVWWDSQVRVQSDLLGHRYLEVEKGRNGEPSVYTNSAGDYMVLKRFQAYQSYTNMAHIATNEPANLGRPRDAILNDVTNQLMTLIRTHRSEFYTNAITAKYNRAPQTTGAPETRNYYWIPPIDAPSLSDRLDNLAGSVERSLPNIFRLTNQLAAVLSNANAAVLQADATLAQTHPTLTNLALITANLKRPDGSLGQWLLPTNLQAQLQSTLETARSTLDAAHGTLDTTDTNLTLVATELDHTLQHLSDLTSNLAWQVQVNTNIVGEISTTIVHADDLVQGLKKEWFLRGPFKKKTANPH